MKEITTKVVRISTLKEWELLLTLVDPSSFNLEDYSDRFRANYPYEDIGILLKKDRIDGWSTFNYWLKNRYICINIGDLMPNQITEIW